MQASSAPSTPRIFSFVNTAGAVPPKASVERNAARSYSLRKRGLVTVAICRSKFDTAKTQGKIRLVIMRSSRDAGIAPLRAARLLPSAIRSSVTSEDVVDHEQYEPYCGDRPAYFQLALMNDVAEPERGWTTIQAGIAENSRATLAGTQKILPRAG